MGSRPIRLLICAGGGRMASRVAALASADPRFEVMGSLDRATGPARLSSLVSACDALVDFSAPAPSLAWAGACAKVRKACVIGTTGFSPAQQARLAALARKTALFQSPNFSPGMTLLFELAALASTRLSSFDAAVSETHHKRKKDAPSGTALRLARAATRSASRPPAIVSLRLGDVVGEHTLTLAGPFERLELTHRAHSRDVFALGALEAALWTAGRRPGLYGMEDLNRR